VLSVAWYQLAADASPGIVEQRRGRGSEARSGRQFDGVSREREVRLTHLRAPTAGASGRGKWDRSSQRSAEPPNGCPLRG
jgi:hypothetical protein